MWIWKIICLIHKKSGSPINVHTIPSSSPFWRQKFVTFSLYQERPFTFSISQVFQANFDKWSSQNPWLVSPSSLPWCILLDFGAYSFSPILEDLGFMRLAWNLFNWWLVKACLGILRLMCMILEPNVWVLKFSFDLMRDENWGCCGVDCCCFVVKGSWFMYLNGSNMNLSCIGVEKFKFHIVYVWPIYKNQWGFLLAR